LEYQTLTVEQILNKFQKELEQDALGYLDQAKRVCEYDAVLRDSQRDLAHLTSQTQRLLLEQEQVEQTLLGIGAFQDQLETTLSQVEQQVDELFTSQSHLAPHDADVERERAYQTANHIDYRLEELTESLRTTFGHLTNANQKAFNGEVGQIVTILNQHQDGLGQLESAARTLELDVTHVGRLLATSRS
jgi:nuclear pore complex protein Nup62